MKKIKLREVLLLIVPSVALGTWAWQGKTLHWPADTIITPHGPLSVQIREVRIEPATPRQVYEGYDTRVVILHEMPDVSAAAGGKANDRVAYYLAGKDKLSSQDKSYDTKLNQAKRISCEETAINSRQGYSCGLRLRDIPPNIGEIRFHKTTLGANYYFKAPAGSKRVPVNPTDVSLVVRRARQKISVPTVSKHRPFRLQSLTVHKVTPEYRIGNEDTAVRLVLEKTESGLDDFSYRCVARNSWLIDSEGEKWPNTNMTGTQEVLKDGGPTAKTVEREFLFPLRLIPKSAGRITFKTEVSYNDGWPLPIEIVVRKK